MSVSPVALFANCLDPSSSSRADPLVVVKDILPESFADFRTPWPNSRSYDWAIANKYYTADVNLVSIASPLLPGEPNPALEERLAERVEALVLCFAGGSAPSFNLVKHWLPFVDRFSPNVRLLLCEKCDGVNNEEGPARSDVIAWCIENQFELVELDEEGDDGDEDDDESDDGLGRPFGAGEFGLPRLVAALHAHTWSNLEMKENGTEAAGGKIRNQSSQSQENNSRAGNEGGGEKEETERSADRGTDGGGDDHLKEILENLNLMGDATGEEDDEESFEQLFNKMAHLKNQSQNLPFEERKVFAEQVTMAFWRAIGGDEDELGGLDNDDEDD